jgi:MSHA biogenesis protein MshK
MSTGKKAIGNWPLAAGKKYVIAIAIITSGAHAGELADPTRPPVVARKAIAAAPSVVATPRVTAIFQSGERRIAVFDGQVVKAGDRIGDIFIEAVLADGVRYRRSDRVEVARLAKQAVSVRRKVDSEENEP